MKLSRKDIFLIMKGHLNENVNVAYEKIEEVISEQMKYSVTIAEADKQSVRKLMTDLKSRWQTVARNESKFLEKYKEWLEVFVNFNIPEKKFATPEQPVRPNSDFSTLSGRSKRRRTQELRATTSLEELSYATQMSLRVAGQLDASKVVKEVTSGDSSKAQEYRRSLDCNAESTMSAEDAVSLCVEQRLSVNQYRGLRAASLANNCKLYPPYKTVLKAKQQCYPLKADMTFTESSGEVKLQSLLHHTSERILLAQKEVVKNLTSDHLCNLNLVCKWGCDGTSGQSIYKQKFVDDENASKSDASIFFTSLVPLQLTSAHDQTIVWKNPRPSSSRFCRPLRIQFLVENVETTMKEMNYIQEQEKQVEPFHIIMDGKEITVSYQLAFTMIGGKVCNALTNTASAQRCYLRQATSKDFNDIDAMLKRKITEGNLKFGISSLHAWIRFFECCLHISYKLDIKK